MYLYNLLIAIDQLLNVLICNGSPYETMSSVSYRMEQEGRFWGFLRPIIDTIFSPWEHEHCKKSYESFYARTHMKD